MSQTITATVDGTEAEIKQHDEQHPDDKPLVQFPAFDVPLDAYKKLQALFDDGIFTTSANLSKGKSKPCGANAVVDGVVVACPHRSVLRAVYIDECASCHRKKTTTEEELCLGHSALHWGAGESVKAQLEMEFE